MLITAEVKIRAGDIIHGSIRIRIVRRMLFSRIQFKAIRFFGLSELKKRQHI